MLLPFPVEYIVSQVARYRVCESDLHSVYSALIAGGGHLTPMPSSVAGAAQSPVIAGVPVDSSKEYMNWRVRRNTKVHNRIFAHDHARIALANGYSVARLTLPAWVPSSS